MEEEDEEQDIFQLDDQVEHTQKARLAALKARRDGRRVEASLKDLGAAIDRGENVMPCLIESVKCYATIGEISAVMREKWGEYQSPVHI